MSHNLTKVLTQPGLKEIDNSNQFINITLEWRYNNGIKLYSKYRL